MVSNMQILSGENTSMKISKYFFAIFFSLDSHKLIYFELKVPFGYTLTPYRCKVFNFHNSVLLKATWI